MDAQRIERLKRRVKYAPRDSVRLARHTAGTTFHATLGAVVVTEQESARLMRSLVRRSSPRASHWLLPLGYRSEHELETYIEGYVRYLLQLRRMPTLSEVKQLEETIGRLMEALDQVLEEKKRVKAEHAGEVPSEWIEDMVAILGRKPRPADVPSMQTASSAPAAPPSGDHVPAPSAPPRDPEKSTEAKPPPRLKEPFPGYRTLSAVQIQTQIYAMTPQQLRKVQQYEEQHHRRVTILRAVEAQLAVLGESPGTGPQGEEKGKA
ncbi:MAG: hypothetical protein U0822_16550 [Anaerolineae bacterium]